MSEIRIGSSREKGETARKAATGSSLDHSVRDSQGERGHRVSPMSSVKKSGRNLREGEFAKALQMNLRGGRNLPNIFYEQGGSTKNEPKQWR